MMRPRGCGRGRGHRRDVRTMSPGRFRTAAGKGRGPRPLRVRRTPVELAPAAGTGEVGERRRSEKSHDVADGRRCRGQNRKERTNRYLRNEWQVGKFQTQKQPKAGEAVFYFVLEQKQILV